MELWSGHWWASGYLNIPPSPCSTSSPMVTFYWPCSVAACISFIEFYVARGWILCTPEAKRKVGAQ